VAKKKIPVVRWNSKKFSPETAQKIIQMWADGEHKNVIMQETGTNHNDIQNLIKSYISKSGINPRELRWESKKEAVSTGSINSGIQVYENLRKEILNIVMDPDSSDELKSYRIMTLVAKKL